MKHLLITPLLLLLLINVGLSQSINKERLQTAKKTTVLVKKKKYQDILKLFPDEIAKSIPEKTLVYYVDMGAKFIEEHGFPKDSDLMTQVKFINTKEGMMQVSSIIFPFPAPKEKNSMPKRIIEVSFMEKYGNSKIAGLNIREMKPMSIIQPTKVAFLDSLDFGVDSLKSWRIYYSKGNIKNDNRDVFAVSGNKDKLKELNIEDSFKKLFSSLKNAEIVEKTVLNDIIRYEGKPEKISLRWQFDGDNKFYRISVILTPEQSTTEPLSDYIIVSSSVYANEQSIYKIKKSDVPDIVKLLEEWTNRDWGNDYELRP